MTLFSSLTNRIFFASALLAVLSIGVAVYRVNVAVTQQAEQELGRGLEEAATLLEQYRTTLFEHFAREAQLIADLPRLKATVALKHPPTVEPIAREYQKLVDADLLVVTDGAGGVLAQIGGAGLPAGAADWPGIRRAAAGQEAASFWPHPGGVLQVVSVPIVIGREQPDILGTLSIGFSLDERAAARFKALTNSEIAFAVGGAVEASTLPPAFSPQLAGLVGRPGGSALTLGDSDYVWVTRRLLSPRASGARTEGEDQGTPIAIILRSRTERLRFLGGLHTQLGFAAIVAVLAATILSYAIARTVTRPLGAITATMREMAATGDLARRRRLPAPARWDDEDARLLAATFNAMTDSIARFQHEASQRERLTSLGRLSTVVAHEIRNPLMIIKASLRTLRREDVRPDQLHAAVADIDEEIGRLNRIVSEVLDFARPIRFEYARAALNGICADAAEASARGAGQAPADIELDLAPEVGDVVTDPERLRIALVNILVNAQHAVQEAPHRSVRISTRRLDHGRVAIRVQDTGAGIAPDDLPNVFDPYFTTKRTGTGLGLAIARTIVQGLGGTIQVSSRQRQGTEIRIDLPAAAPGAAAAGAGGPADRSRTAQVS